MSQSNAPRETRLPGRRHRAARVEDWVHAIRLRVARQRGQTPVIVTSRGYGSTEWVRIFGRVLLHRPTALARPPLTDTRVRGWRSFTSVPVGNVAVRIEIGSATHDVIADRGGVIDSRIPVALTPGWHTARLTTAGADSVTALVRVVSAEPGIGIISDVDDTIMVTALPRPFLAFWNTFVLDEHARSPTPGMAVLYERLMRAHPEALIVYLSTGAWNVAPTLDRFLNRNLYPPGPLLLTDWGPTHDRWFRSGREHKMENLRRLCEEFPHIRWLLIGDDGQHDEEIYATIANEHPTQIAAIVIRRLTTGEVVLAGRRAKPTTTPPGVARLYGSNGAVLATKLGTSGLL